jgi:hypothetical protein
MFRRLGFGVAAAWICVAGGAGAAESVTVSIHTTVLPVCRFMGSIVPASPVPGMAEDGSSPTGAITYQCTNGVAPSFAITASTACPGCTDASASAPVIVSDARAIGRGMGSGRELMLVVAAPMAPASLQTALSSVSITVSP